MKYLFILSSLLFSISASEPYIEIEDLSDLPYLSSDLAERKTAKLLLPNGVQVLCISDPNADQSAVMVAVGSGYWSDPEEYPGMAHFCEHMLFMGTEKYPDSNEFSAQVANFGGKTNAYTAPDRTVYMFSSFEKGFLPLLDQFAHFFIDPIFDPSNISREMHAVDQEFALQIETDFWRRHHVFKELGNPHHPNHSFSTGNSKTLSDIPQSALKKWHSDHYGAEKIRVVLYSSLPIHELKEAAASAFAAVPKGTLEQGSNDGPLTSEAQRGHIVSIEPIQQKQMLYLSWELPSQMADDESKSSELIAYALSRGGSHSLLQKLKNEKLVDDALIRVDTHEGIRHPFFEIVLALSNQGMENPNAVITYVFQAIQGLKISGIPEFLFEEKNRLSKLQYQYQKREDAFEYVYEFSDTILSENLATYPKKTLLASKYSSEKIEEVLSLLSPEQCCITYMVPKEISKVAYDKTEEWLKVPYTVRPISPQTLIAWNEAKPNPEIQVPEPNPFIPANLHLEADPELGSIPVQIADSPMGTAYYVRSPEFKTPEAAVHLHIYTPEVNGNAKSYVLSSLYLDHLTDQLHPLLMNAQSAGLKCRFKIEKSHIHLTLGGFSEKIPLLLQQILQQMPLHPPTKEQFDLYFARHEKEYVNGGKTKPVIQAMELMSSLINTDKTTKQENLSALKSIAFEDFTNFHKKLFERTYFEALFAGNLPLKAAESAYLDILHILGKQAFPKEERPQRRVLCLPNGDGPFAIAKQTDALGNAAVLLIDEGAYTLEKKGMQKILSSSLKDPFFDTLRTKQKTGYYVQTSDAESEKRLYQYFLVQSNSHQPDDLLHRFELFLEEFGEDFSSQVSPERFEILKMSAIEKLKTENRNIEAKSDLWDELAFDEEGDFQLIEKEIQALQNLSYERFSLLARETLSRKNSKRLAILYTGRIQTPFVYLPITADNLGQIATYAPRSKQTEHHSE